MPSIQDLIKVSWFAVKERLEGMENNYISYERYLQICEEEGISNSTEQNILIGFLHDLGIVLNFPRRSEYTSKGDPGAKSGMGYKWGVGS